MSDPRWDLPVDWLAPDRMSSDERAAIEHWYVGSHGEGDLRLIPMVSFWLDHSPSTFKRYRRWAETAMRAGTLPLPAVALVQVHAYARAGWSAGTHYEAIAAREWGVGKRALIETLALAFVRGGPLACGRWSAELGEYLGAWTTDVEGRPEIWPPGWAPDTGAFRSGMDFATYELLPGELENLEAWYGEHQGAVPEDVARLAATMPEVLKSLRDRYEHATETLPKQIVPILAYHDGVLRRAGGAMRRARHQALKYGVTESQLASVEAFATLYLGDVA